MMSQLTWYLEVDVTGAAHGGDGRSLALPGDAFLHSTFTQHLDSERTSCLHKQFLIKHAINIFIKQ